MEFDKERVFYPDANSTLRIAYGTVQGYLSKDAVWFKHYSTLKGINFDRAWEGVASDMAFNPDQSRNISLDIRYVLFIIDKYADAGYLLKEMTIVE
jgi:hypothetical protein